LAAHRIRWCFATCCAAIVVGACHGASATGPDGTVTYQLVTSTCQGITPIQFFVDHGLVGVDTFRFGYGPSVPVHTTSPAFSVSPGQHGLSARALVLFGNGYTWTEQTVTLEPGGAVIDSLPLYCS